MGPSSPTYSHFPAACAAEKSHRILVVDDNEAIHDDFRKIFRSDPADRVYEAARTDLFGPEESAVPSGEFQIDFAVQGDRALELVRQAVQTGARYALVFMDVRMPPGWDGLETTGRLWEVDPDLQIVICTAYSDKSWEEMMGTLRYPERVLVLKKPFDTIEVLQLAHALTDKWSLLQASRINTRELERTVSVRTRELVAANHRLEAETAAHKAAAERVREQAMLLEKARDAIMVLDLSGRISFWNQGAAVLYGWTAKEALGQNFRQLLHGGEAPSGAAVFDDRLLAEGSWSGELSQQTREGLLVMAECRWTLLRDDVGQPKSVLAIHSDVTEKKQLEAKFLRAQRMESIGTLAGGIAHDLNNILHPLTLAMGVLRTQVPASSREMLDLVCNNAQRASELVGQVLSFARGVEGQRILVKSHGLAEEIASIVRETFPKNVQFVLSMEEQLWPLVGDATQLHQVLLNLCVNARDAMPKGGTLTLAVENAAVTAAEAAAVPDAVSGRHVVLAVTDTGTGISPALREKIWDPFFTTKELGKGTGLGLATTQSIVRSHGGFITMFSQEGAGTTFRVFLPAAVEPASPSGSAGKELARDLHDLRGRGELILVVDDEAPLRIILRQTLEHFGYRVLTASDGVEALAVYAERGSEIQTVITDLIMPVLDGPDFIAELKRRNPRAKVIATTGMACPVSIETIRRLGVHQIIIKPCAPTEMLTALRQSLAETVQ